MTDTAARHIIDRLLTSLELKTQAQLAARLDIRPQSIISAIHRGEIPAAWLYKAAYLTGRSVEWLRTGKGTAWHGMAIAEGRSAPYGSGKSFQEPLLKLLEGWERLDGAKRAALLRCLSVLEHGDPDLGEHLIAQSKLIEETMERRRTKRTGRRDPSAHKP